MHICTEGDVARFDPPRSNFQGMKVRKAFEDKHMYCLDYDKLQMSLQGSWKDGQSYKVFDAMLIPCATKVQLFDGSFVGGDEDCVWD